jgi:hypothetical protein
MNGMISVENTVTPVTQAIFNHKLSLLPGGGSATRHARDRPNARAFAGGVGISHDAADGTTDNRPTDRAPGGLAAYLFRDFLTLRQIMLVPSHVDPGGIDDDVGAPSGAGRGGDKVHENEGISDYFHDGFPFS